MAHTIADNIVGIQGIVRAVSGVKVAPNYPPGKLGPFPMAVAYPSQGVMEGGYPAGEMRALNSVTLDLFIERIDLPYDVKTAIAFGDSIPAALWADVTLGNTASTFSRMTWRFGVLSYSGRSDWMGWRFTIENIKQRTVL